MHAVSSIHAHGLLDAQDYVRDFQAFPGFPFKIFIGLWFVPAVTAALGSYNVV